MSAGEFIITDKLKSIVWPSPSERQSAYTVRGGNDDVITLGRPYWGPISFVYENLDKTTYRALTAWLARRKGARVSFTAARISRRAPLLAPNMTNAGLGVASVNISAGTVNLTGLGSNTLSPGDMVGFSTAASGYWLGETLATAVPSGGNATVSVWPYPQTPHATPNVRLFEALGEFKLASLPRNSERAEGRASVSFDAVQVVR